jgi:hypothetical protein
MFCCCLAVPAFINVQPSNDTPFWFQSVMRLRHVFWNGGKAISVFMMNGNNQAMACS